MDSPSLGQRNPERASKVTWVPCGLCCGVRLKVRVEAEQIDIHVKFRKGQTIIARQFGNLEQQEGIEYFIEQVAVKHGHEYQHRLGGPFLPGQGALDKAQHPPTPDENSSFARDFKRLRDERPCTTEAVRKYLWCFSSRALDRLQQEGLPVSQQEILMCQLSEWLIISAEAAYWESSQADLAISHSFHPTKAVTAAAAAATPPQVASHDQLLQLRQLSSLSLCAQQHLPAEAAGHADLAPPCAGLLAGAGPAVALHTCRASNAGCIAAQQVDGHSALPSEANMSELLLAPQHDVLLASCSELSPIDHTAPRSGGAAPGSVAAASIALLAREQLSEQVQRLQLLEKPSFVTQISASTAKEGPNRSSSVYDRSSIAVAPLMGRPAAGNSSSAGPQAGTAVALPSLGSLCFSGAGQTCQYTPAAADRAVQSAGMSDAISGVMAAAAFGTPGVHQLGEAATAGQNMQGHVHSPAHTQLPAHAVPRIGRTALTIVEKIGEGGFGEVSLADAPVYGRVVLKLLKDEWQSSPAANINREACTLARANHPNVLRFYALVTAGPADDSVEGFIMEHVKGGSMLDFLTLRQSVARSPLPFWLCCKFGLAICHGLQYLHQLGIVHQDLKLENILLDASPAVISAAAAAAAEGPDPDSEVPVLKIADFGLSKSKQGEYVSHCADMPGTLNYMAPECVYDPHHISEKADVWSAGLIFWEFVSMQRPFQGLNALQIYHALQAGAVQLDVPAGCHPDWAFLIGRCVDPNPAARPTMAELGSLMQLMLDQQRGQQAQHQLGIGHVQQQHMQQQMQPQVANLLPVTLPAPTPNVQLLWQQQWQQVQNEQLGQLLMQQGAPPRHLLSVH